MRYLRPRYGVTAGYSGTPLAKKLSLKDGHRTWWDGMPDSVRDEIRREVPALALLDMPGPAGRRGAYVRHPMRHARLQAAGMLLPLLARDGFVWVSWPKKASKVPTDITEDVIRAVALALGPGRREGLRRRRDLVGPEAGHPQGARAEHLLRTRRIIVI